MARASGPPASGAPRPRRLNLIGTISFDERLYNRGRWAPQKKGGYSATPFQVDRPFTVFSQESHHGFEGCTKTQKSLLRKVGGIREFRKLTSVGWI